MDVKGNQDGGGDSVEGKLKCCIKCSEWEDKWKQAEGRFTKLESEFADKMSELGFLQDKISTLEVEKLRWLDGFESLRKRNKDLEEKITRPIDGNSPIGGVRKGAEAVVDLTDDMEENKALELMIEIQVLDCEKKKAESEVQLWKSKCRELECRVMELEQPLTSGGGDCVLTTKTEVGAKFLGVGREEINMAKGSQGGFSDAVTPLVDTYCRNLTPLEERKRGIVCKKGLEYGSRARKHLVFEEETSFSKKIAPATPAGVRPASLSVIDISDSDGETDAADLVALDTRASEKAFESSDYRGISLDKKQFPCENLTASIYQSDEDDVCCHKRIAPSMSTCKRKRSSNIVTSDSESDTDDNLPISRLRTNSKTDAASSWDEEGGPVRRRLLTWRELKENKPSQKSLPSDSKSMKTEHLCGIPTCKISEDDEIEEEDGSESESESESLSKFIVNDSDISDADSKGGDTSTVGSPFNDDSLGELGAESDGNIGYADIIARIGRCKEHKAKWEFQADLLAAFGKDPELCMKAVCALYRQQTSDEKLHKATIVSNGRGFNQFHAYSGSILGEFLTDGDPDGDLKKSVEELEVYDPEGLEKCRYMAGFYSDQLFKISQNGEDPSWPPIESK